MNRAIKSLNFLAVIILIAVILGCDSDGGGQGATQALTERDFFDNPNLSANPEKGVVVHFLEHPDSEKPESDTGEVGVDTIPYTYTRTLRDTFCWEDDDDDAEHFMVLEDSEGNEIFRLDVNGECITVVLEAGDYLMQINHDGRIEKTHTIFIRPGRSGEQEAQKIDTNEGLLKSAKSLFSKILNDLHIIITQKVKAQGTGEPSANFNKLLSSAQCPGCNLMCVDFTGGKVFPDVNLLGANLKCARLDGANLRFVDLTVAFLDGANLNNANLFRTKLPGAFLQCTKCEGKTTCTNLSGANLNNTDLAGAFLTGADLTGAIIDLDLEDQMGADFSGATWCDGCTCGAGSIGKCEGCAATCIGTYTGGCF